MSHRLFPPAGVEQDHVIDKRTYVCIARLFDKNEEAINDVMVRDPSAIVATRVSREFEALSHPLNRV
jgi:hypothetical protein